ncbi:MAG TPA: hypothetical protein DGG94_03040 [Micromonosporaceae bacterium]|nr:hypothetical protein [Micromonosporaceae bacterium]HCU48792.1 hypothetical protein [Micromonosporaceae bacterium]
MATELHNTRKVKLLGQTLRDEITRLGFDLPPGDSAQRLVASKAEEVAATLGITPRTVLTSYMTDESMREMAKAVARQMKGLTAVLDEAPPIELDARHGYTVLAAFGMCEVLALHNLDHPNAMIVLKDAADSTVQVAVSLAQGSGETREISGLTLSVARKVITMALDMLRNGQWRCTCCAPGTSTVGCELQRRLAVDLGHLGGWTPPR